MVLVGGLFISYRRQDAAAAASRLYEDLTARYGPEDVFLDIATLQPGQDWARNLRRAVASSDAMLVLIGPQWLTAQDADGRRRIDDPHDRIRSEVAAALQLDKRVIPVLVDGAAMPSLDELPANLVHLATLQAASLRYERWREDAEQLYRMLKISTSTSTRPSFFNRLEQAFAILLGRTDIPATPSAPIISTAPPLSARPPMSLRPRNHDVFVSYSSGDEHVVNEVLKAIETEGPRCWIAHRDIPPGVGSWAEPIVSAIASSRLVLVLLTARSISSIDVLREVTLAADEEIPLLPVSLDSTTLTPSLRYFFVASQRLELAGLGQADQLRRIVPAVTRLLS